MSDISDAMRAARKKKGWSRQWLVIKSGVAMSNVYQYETGRNEPGINNLVKLADALGISIDEYIGRERFAEEKQSTEIP